MNHYFRVLINYEYKEAQKGKAHKLLGVLAKDVEEATKKVQQYLESDYFEINTKANGKIHVVEQIGSIDIQ